MAFPFAQGRWLVWEFHLWACRQHKAVASLPFRFRGRRIGEAIHGRLEPVALELEPHVVKIKRLRRLILVRGAPLYQIRAPASAAGYEVGDAVDDETLVVVYMTRRDDELRVRSRSNPRQVVAQ